MRHNEETSFWGGKRKADVDKINTEIPVMGEVKNKTQRPVLEEYRKLANAYYRFYNDGDAFYNKLRWMADRYNIKPFRGFSEEDLERLADAVTDAALAEQAAAKNAPPKMKRNS
jgi:hypothetical protein